MLDKLAKSLGIRNPMKPGTTIKPIAPPKARENKSGTRQEAKQNAIHDQHDEKNYFARLAEQREQLRLQSLLKDHSSVRKYFKTLSQIEPECECIGYLDCDVDLRALAVETGIDKLERDQDRFLLYRRTHEWIIGLAKRRGTSRADYYSSAPLFEADRPDLALIDLKVALRLH